MRILVTGSRNWNNEGIIWDTLDGLLALPDWPPLIVVHGACPRGADAIAQEWVEHYQDTLNVKAEQHPAVWKVHGKQAGFIRNADMVRLGADLCLAFIRNYSNGACHARGLAVQDGIPVRTFREDADGVYLGQEWLP